MRSVLLALYRRFLLAAEDIDHFFVRMVRSGKKHWQGLVVWGFAGLFIAAGLLALWAANLRLPDLSTIEQRKIEQSLKIYDRTGQTLLYDLHNEKQRTIVPLSEISPNIQHATIAIEDADFYTHGGIRPLSILRAIVSNLLHADLFGQGGSTITQQVVKGSILTADKSITRKLKEWILAIKLDQALSKDKILELYLNQIPYGGTLYGVEEASQAFFGKHASDVSVPEAAYLAAILPAPTYYSPYGEHKDALDARKNLVLQKMLEHGYLTQGQYEEAKAAAVTFLPPHDQSIQAPHFVFYVRQYLENKYGSDALEEGGWRVTTTLDASLQAKAEEIVRAGAIANTTKFNASNAALIALDPATGGILAMVGSRNYFDTQIPGAYNAATSKPGRQPGSAFKPFAYAVAFEKGYTPDTVLFDVRTQFSTTCGPFDFTSQNGCYSPVNYDNKFRGPITLRNALAQSINIPSVKVLYLAGIADTIRLAKAMGITTLESPDRYGLTLVLGGGEVTLLDMTSAYGVFATDGVRHDPTAILKIEDPSGTVIEDNSATVGNRVLPVDVAQKINDVLSDSVAREPLGVNASLNFPGHDVAVKTGTTNDYRDAWTIGYTPTFVLGMWAGNNDNTPMEKKVSGLIVGPMWHDVMNYALQSGLATGNFSRAEPVAASKPILNGEWQNLGSDGKLHEILYWLNKDDPAGPTPPNLSDPQLRLWDPPVAAWTPQG
jgi:1A family penicillin-binding protein